MNALPASAPTLAMSSLRDRSRPRLGQLYVWSVPLAAAAGGLKGIRLFGLEYTGFLWLAYFVAGWFLLLGELSVRRETRPTMPMGRWLVWLAVVWGSFGWGDRGWRNVQDALQLSLPVLVGALASIYIRRAADLWPLLRNCGIATAGIGVLFIADKLGLISAVGLVSDIRACALTLALYGAFFLAAIPDRWFWPLVGWSGCILLTFVTGGRMATAAILATPVLHPRLKSTTIRLAAIAFFLAAGIGLFYTPVFQKRFFYEGKGTLSQALRGDFLGAGRFEAWPLIYAEAENTPWLGHGVGTTRSFVPTVWEEMALPHNDYLRIWFELGLLGLSVFLLAALAQMISLGREMSQAKGIVRYAFAAALLGWFVFLISACTDNPLIYAVWFTNPLFALMGAAYGVATREPRDAFGPGFLPGDSAGSGELHVTILPLPDDQSEGRS